MTDMYPASFLTDVSPAASFNVGSQNLLLDGTPVQPVPSSRFPMPKDHKTVDVNTTVFRQRPDGREITGVQCPGTNSKETLVH